MKLKNDTAGVSFTCTRAPEQRVNFDTGQPQRVRAFHVTDPDITDLTTRFSPPRAHSNGNEHNLDDPGPEGSNR